MYSHLESTRLQVDYNLKITVLELSTGTTATTSATFADTAGHRTY